MGLEEKIKEYFDVSCVIENGEITLEIPSEQSLPVCLNLRDKEGFKFEMLTDLCGVDVGPGNSPRFVVVYHLLSLAYNQRLRLKTFAAGEPPKVNSVISVWESANWYEREAFDMFGIVFNDHPDLRRLLTDYGFLGHPLRKDFPLQGVQGG